MKLDDFNYNLPEELIAQHPEKERDHCKLLVLKRSTGQVLHHSFFEIIDMLNPGDCLVMNNSKVLPARLFGTKEGTGAKVEFLLIKRIEGELWETMVKPGKRLKPGDSVAFGDNGELKAAIKDYGDDGTRIVEFNYEGIFMELLEKIGSMPLPPYIERKSDEEDTSMYQTVYCKEEGSVASPTAGLHFTDDLLEKISEKGIDLAYVTLHVGIGTFRPVKCDNILEHSMHFEEYSIDEDNAEIINKAIRECRRVISVGTTSTRTLESANYFDEEAKKYFVKAEEGSTDIFIYPGYKFKIVDSLITNFHLPKSTLLMLISALYDREKILEAYKIAVDEKYRFFSYGDAMFIE